MEPVALVIMECSSVWPEQTGDTIVVGWPLADEELLRQTRQTLSQIDQRKQSLRAAVIVCNSTTRPGAEARRAALARTLLTSVRLVTHGKLIICTSAGADEDLREQLFTLAGELTGELLESTASVAIWFTESPTGRVIRTAATHGTPACAPSPPPATHPSRTAAKRASGPFDEGDTPCPARTGRLPASRAKHRVHYSSHNRRLR
jgi:hypothetical protein